MDNSCKFKIMCGIVELMGAQLPRGISHNLALLHKNGSQALKRCIAEYLERLGSIWRNKNWCRSELLFQHLEAFFTLRSPKEFLVFLEEISDRLCDFGEVLNETAAIACQTEEAPDLFDVLRCNPLDYGLDSLWIHGNAFGRDDMPKVGDFGKPKLTLGELGVEAMFTKLFENEAKMLFMLFFRFGVDKNVVKIDHHEFVEILHEDIIHEARESCRCIGEAKGHDGVFIETVPSSKSGLWNILLANFYLMVTASQVQLREHYGTCKLIE
jgi:hypothetical protein